jgi:hypothetical protein
MELRNRTTGAVITESQFRNDNRNTSFPKVLTPEIIDSFGYDPVLEGPQAQTTPPYEISVRNGVEEVNGQWFTKYVVGPVFTDTEDTTAAEQEAAYRQGLDDEQAQRIREDCNKRLADSDWTQLPDAPVNAAEWAQYRLELRNVVNQQGFPWNVEWPSEPPESGPDLPNYKLFWDALMVSTIYTSIREQSFVSLPMNTLATEFIALIGDAKAGRANETAIQASMAAILTTGTFGDDDLIELQAALAAGNLDGIYTLT